MTNQAPRDGRRPTKLKRVMFDKGISNKRLAELTGLSEWTVSRHANGLIPPPQTQQRYADYLGRPVTDLWPHNNPTED